MKRWECHLYKLRQYVRWLYGCILANLFPVEIEHYQKDNHIPELTGYNHHARVMPFIVIPVLPSRYTDLIASLLLYRIKISYFFLILLLFTFLLRNVYFDV